MSRPELQLPPDLFYNDKEARKYDSNSRMQQIQTEITNRCLELLTIPEDKKCLILDIGCGSGLSGDVIEEAGHHWIGCDISHSMLKVAQERELSGDLLLHDMGLGLPFRSAIFDGVVSVSALQWLCYSDVKEQIARHRLTRFFSSLYQCLKRDARAALQFYPETPEQAVMIASAASRVGFAGGLVVDYPNSTKAKKYYLCLSFERSYRVPTPLGIGEGVGVVSGDNGLSKSKREKAREYKKNRGNRPPTKGKQWILQKKEKQRNQGKTVCTDSKYTGRKRHDRF